MEAERCSTGEQKAVCDGHTSVLEGVAVSPDGRQLAVVTYEDGPGQIYLMAAGAPQLKNITNSSVFDYYPAWSPDGKKIAYTVKRVGAYQVWSMNEDGQEAVQLVHSGQELWDYLPSWSPDGRTVFFNQRRLGAFRPWLMQIDYEDLSQEPRRMNFVTPIEDVSFSADGYWIVFEGMDGEGNRDIYFMTVAGSGRTRLTNDLTGSTIQPNGVNVRVTGSNGSLFFRLLWLLLLLRLLFLDQFLDVLGFDRLDFRALLHFFERRHLDDVAGERRGLRGWHGRRGRLNGRQLHLEKQRGVRLDVAAAHFAVGQFRRDEQLPLGANFHPRERLGPAADDATGDPRGVGPAGLGRAVEFVPVDKSPAIVHRDRVLRLDDAEPMQDRRRGLAQRLLGDCVGGVHDLFRSGCCRETTDEARNSSNPISFT